MSILKIVFIHAIIFSSLTTSIAAESTKEEASISSQLLEQVFNSIDQSQLDINIDSVRVNSETEKIEKERLAINGILKFAKNWKVELVKTSENTAVANEMRKIYPLMTMDSSQLSMSFNYEVKDNKTKLQVNLFDKYDLKLKKWLTRPLTIQISNQLNKSLFKIRLHSFTLKLTPQENNELSQDVEGTCESDKELYDIVSGKTKLIPMNCKIIGTLDEKGYQLQVIYNNKK